MGAHGVSDPAKTALRKAVWAGLKEAGAGRFPGIVGRIPNFVGAEAAARALVTHPAFVAARTLKCNPDSPQRPVRHAALKQGKAVFVAVPRLREAHPFVRLDPTLIPANKLWEASSIKGAAVWGRPVSIDALPTLELIVTGCVAVGKDGARLGKGGGYSDLEYALLREAAKVGPDTVIATTLHPVQWLAAGRVPTKPHDISLDLVALPDGVQAIRDRRPRPSGILWSELSAEQVHAIPVLRALCPG